VAFGPDRIVRLFGLAALVSIAAYLFTPGSASGPWGHPLGFHYNLRYSAPALVLAMIAGPLARPFVLHSTRYLVVAGLSWLFVATVAEAWLWGPHDSLGGQIATAAGVLLIGLAAVMTPWQWPHVNRSVRRAAWTTVAVLLSCAGIAGAYSGEQRYLRGRNRVEPGLPPITSLWRWADGIHHQRIAMAGTYGWYFGYPLYGENASNEVVYLGEHGPHGAFTPFRTCQAFRQALNRGHFRYVVTTSTRVMWIHAIAASPEGAWLRGVAAARVLLPIGGPASIVVWELNGRLPTAC
jgi:hypothetical protein